MIKLAITNVIAMLFVVISTLPRYWLTNFGNDTAVANGFRQGEKTILFEV